MKRIGTSLVLMGAMSFGAGRAQDVRPDLSVRMHVTVVRGDVFITDLQPEAFIVSEKGKAQKIEKVARIDGPASVCLVVDSSGSTRGKTSPLRDIASAFLKLLPPEDEICVVNFNDEAYLDTDLTQDRAKAQAGLARSNSFGGSAIRDACYLAAQYLSKNAKNEVKALVLITDGEDNSSKSKREAMQPTLLRSNVTVYALGAFDRRLRKYQARKASKELDAIAGPTGGVARKATTSAELQKEAERVAKEIHSQYLLTYSPADQTVDRQFRQVDVNVKIPGKPDVRTQSGYYAEKLRVVRK